jgi:hypothetical protein
MIKIKNNLFVIFPIFLFISCKKIDPSNESNHHSDPLHSKINAILDTKSSSQNISTSKIDAKHEIDNVIKFHYSGDILHFSFSINPEGSHDLKRIDNQIFQYGIFGSSFILRSLNSEESKAENFVNLLAKDARKISAQLLSDATKKTYSINNTKLPDISPKNEIVQVSHNNINNQESTEVKINEDFNFSYVDTLYKNGDYKNFLTHFKKINVLISLEEHKDNKVLQDDFIKHQKNYFIEGFLKVPNKPIPVIKDTAKYLNKKYLNIVYNKLILDNDETFIEYICLAFIASLNNDDYISNIYNSKLKQIQYTILNDSKIKENIQIFFKDKKLDEELLFNTFLKNVYNFNKNSVPDNVQQLYKNKLITLVERINK